MGNMGDLCRSHFRQMKKSFVICVSCVSHGTSILDETVYAGIQNKGHCIFLMEPSLLTSWNPCSYCSCYFAAWPVDWTCRKWNTGEAISETQCDLTTNILQIQPGRPERNCCGAKQPKDCGELWPTTALSRNTCQISCFFNLVSADVSDRLCPPCTSVHHEDHKATSMPKDPRTCLTVSGLHKKCIFWVLR
jgi:hypothetical protein